MRCGLWKLAAVAGVAFVANAGTAEEPTNTNSLSLPGSFGTVGSGSSDMLLAQSGAVPRKNYYNQLFLDKNSSTSVSTTPTTTSAPAATPNAAGLPTAPTSPSSTSYADLFKSNPTPSATTAQTPAAAPAIPTAGINAAWNKPPVTGAANASAPTAPATANPYGFYGSQPIANTQPQAPSQTPSPQVQYNTASYSQANYAPNGQAANAMAPSPYGQPAFGQAGFANTPQTPVAAQAAPAGQIQPFGQIMDPAFGGNPFAQNSYAPTTPAAAPQQQAIPTAPTQPYQAAPMTATAQAQPQAQPTSAPATASVQMAPVQANPYQTVQAAPPIQQPTPAAPAVAQQTKTYATTPQVDAMQSTFNKFKAQEPESTRSLNYADYARFKNQPSQSDVKTVSGTQQAANSFLTDPFMDQKPSAISTTSHEAIAQPSGTANPSNDFTFDFLKKEAAAQATTKPAASPLANAMPKVEAPKAEPAPHSNVTITRGLPSRQSSGQASPPKASFSPAVTTNREFASASLDANHDSPNGPQKPVVKIYWRKTSDFNIGRECTAELVVENQSQADAFDVEAIASFPPQVRLTDAKPAPEESNGRLLWHMGTLPAGKTQIVAVKMIPSQAGALNVSADVRFSASSASEFQVYEPMLNVEVAGPEQVMIGDPASHSVTISNPGTGITKDVKIEAIIPRGIEHPRGEKLLLDVGSLNPGESRTVRLALAATEGGDHRVIIQASAESGLAARAESTIHVISPELTLNVDGPSIRYMGRTGKYKISVKNSGTVGSSNVRVMHKIPTGMKYVSANKGATYDAETRILSWFVGRLAPDASADIEVELLAKEIGDYTHYIRATSEHGAQFDAQVATKIDGVPSLSLEISDLDDPVEVGAPTAYEIVVKNDGSVDATNVAIACELPQGVQFISAQGPTDSLAEIDMILFRPLARLAPGETVVYKVNVKGLIDGNLRTRVRLASDAADQALTFEELTRFYGDAK